MKVLITGGAGYIGSHMALALLDEGNDVVILDNLTTGSKQIVPPKANFIEGDVSDLNLVQKILNEHSFDAVTHFAGSVKVEESVLNPLKYYENNTMKTLRFLDCLINSNVTKFIFSSTAAIYEEKKSGLISETDSCNPSNPYGQSKLMCEKIIKDLSKSTNLKFFILRYFNVAGADPQLRSGQIDELSNHLIKSCIDCVIKKKEFIEIYGVDYDTEDGSCVRDFIHVSDLVSGHLIAIKHLVNGGDSDICNLGYGKGLSVLEIVERVKLISKINYNTKIVGRRKGDVSRVVANSNKMMSKYNWKPELGDIDNIISTALNWEKQKLKILYEN
jgi:UDP-glucose 4-epimerase